MGSSPPDALVIGAGLGGLFSAAYLARAGYRVEVFEKLLFFGGKFTSFERDGFSIPTGALHTLPGGPRGNLARACAELGIQLDLHRARPGLMVRRGDRRDPFGRNLFKPWIPSDLLPLGARLRFGLAVLGLACPPLLPDLSFGSWLRLWGVSPEVRELLDQILAFSIGVPLEQASLRDIGYGLWSQRWSAEGILRGGARSVTDGLVRVIREHGGRLHKGRPAERILVADGAVRGVRFANGEERLAELVVSGVGAAGTAKLLGDDCPRELQAVVDRAVPAYGASHSIRSRVPLTPHSGIEIPLGATYLSGYIQISHGAPELAPEGWHYLLAYQVLDSAQDIATQVEAGRRECHELFPALPDDAVFHTSVYRGDWPAARLGQCLGQVGRQRCPLSFPERAGLSLVSHDAVGHGFAAELIPAAAQRVLRQLQAGHKLGSAGTDTGRST